MALVDLRGNEVFFLPAGLDTRSCLTDIRLGYYTYSGRTCPDTPPPAALMGLFSNLASRTALRALTLTQSQLGRALPDSPYSAPSLATETTGSECGDRAPGEATPVAAGADGGAGSGADETESEAAANGRRPSGTAIEGVAAEAEETEQADAALTQDATEAASAAAAAAAEAAAALDAADAAACAGPAGGLGRLTQLTSLDVESNQLVWLPAGLAAPLAGGLRRLELGDNCLAVVPPGVAALTGLEELGLGRNLLFFFPARELAGLARLRRLDLSWNRLSSLVCPGGGGGAAAADGGVGLEGMTALTSLNVQASCAFFFL